MKKNSNLLIAGAISIATLASFAAASAHFGNAGDVRAAVENGNYSVFQEVVKGTPHASRIDTEDKYNAMRKAHQLREEGNHKDAHVMMESSGLEKIHGRHHSGLMKIHEVVEANDYAAFQEAVKDSPFGQKIDSEEDFQKLQEAHKLRKEGNHDQARAIMKDLGFEKHHKGHKFTPEK